MLPLPRTRKRLAAPFLDFILGMRTPSLLSFNCSHDAGRLATRVLEATAVTFKACYAAAGLGAANFFSAFGSAFGFAPSFTSTFFFRAILITICRPSMLGN